MEHAGKQQITATVLWKCRLVAAISSAAADHSDSAMEAQAIVAAIQQQCYSDSVMGAQASGSYSAAADHSNSAMEAQAGGSYPSAAAGKQQIIATVLWKRRL